MIFFGTKGKTVEGQGVDGIECPNCGTTEFMTFGLLKYFHLYWIPTFPTSKVPGIECLHCKRTLVGKDLPAELSKQIKSTVFTKKKTVPMYSGLIIIALLALYISYAVN